MSGIKGYPLRAALLLCAVWASSRGLPCVQLNRTRYVTRRDLFIAAGLLYHLHNKGVCYMAGTVGSMNKANARQSHKDEKYYANQFFVTERNKKRKIAKEQAKHERHIKRLATAQ
jgi:hypothetical protein